MRETIVPPPARPHPQEIHGIQTLCGHCCHSCYSVIGAWIPSCSVSKTVLGISQISASPEETMAEVKVGDTLPSVILREGQAGFEKPVDVDLTEVIKGKKGVIFGVPGAFTPGCSKSHLPSFLTAQDDLKSKGVDLTICVATNDPYVIQAWSESSGGGDAGIRFFSDSNAELSRALVLAIESDVMVRMRRFSLIAENGKVTNYYSSSENSSNTWAPNVLAAL